MKGSPVTGTTPAAPARDIEALSVPELLALTWEACTAVHHQGLMLVSAAVVLNTAAPGSDLYHRVDDLASDSLGHPRKERPATVDGGAR